MPQVDLETLVSACAGGGADRKIACETLAVDGAADDKDDSDDEIEEKEVIPVDFPPESFWLSKDAEYDWFDRNAFLERKESTKGINPNPTTTTTHPSSNSGSQRFLKPKASIIGLPKTQKTAYAESKRRTCNKPANIRLFPPRRTESMGKPVAEPSSPKVSCMGRVRSKRRRRRSSSKREKPVERSRSGRENRKLGFYSRFVSMFMSDRNHKPAKKVEKERKGEPPVPARKSVKTKKAREIPISTEPVAEPPGLGSMNRRYSGGTQSEKLIAAVVSCRSDVARSISVLIVDLKV
nr:Calcium/calmodulin-dependent protein kinase [Ipomoea batatas]